MNEKEETKFGGGPIALIVVTGLLAILLVLSVITIIRITQEQATYARAEEYLESLTAEDLASEKIRQETIQILLENAKQASFWELLPSYATFLTTIVALAGAFATIWKQLSESRRQQELDRQQRELDRQQRETEGQRRLDEEFTRITTNLGSESRAIQASAAVSIISFLKPENQAFHEQVFTVLLANLKIDHHRAINQLLVDGFERAVRLKLVEASAKGQEVEIDLSNTSLYGIDLAGLGLQKVDLGFADLQTANLSGADLFRARGFQVNLAKARLSRSNLNEARLQKADLSDAYIHEANLVAADLKGANLMRARFYKASLQACHLQKTNLMGAKFEQANLSDTFFFEAKLNEETLKSILKAQNWQKAHFDDEVKSTLEALLEQEG